MKVIGVSGSPLKNSNTDRALKLALESTGLETEFIKLSKYTIAPCNACMQCVKTNKCIIEDDGILLAEKVKHAEALIIAGFTPYSSLDSQTKAFMERMYPLRHRHGYMAGKPGGAIITCAVPEDSEIMPPACEYGINAIKFFMMEEGMDFIGEVQVKGNVPCIGCDYGDSCEMSGIKMLYGPEAVKASVGIQIFEDQSNAVQAAVNLGKNIAAKLNLK